MQWGIWAYFNKAGDFEPLNSVEASLQYKQLPFWRNCNGLQKTADSTQELPSPPLLASKCVNIQVSGASKNEKQSMTHEQVKCTKKSLILPTMMSFTCKLNLSPGYSGFIVPVNQQAKNRVTVLAGVIDSDHLGEIELLYNECKKEYAWNAGEPLRNS